MEMSEPVSASVGAKVVGVLGVAGSAGVIGALVIAAVKEPKTKREWFMRALVAGVGSLFFGPITVMALDQYAMSNWHGWLGLNAIPFVEAMQYAAPVWLVIGCLSWGVFGALSSLNELLKTRGGKAVADRLGMEDKKDE